MSGSVTRSVLMNLARYIERRLSRCYHQNCCGAVIIGNENREYGYFYLTLYYETRHSFLWAFMHKCDFPALTAGKDANAKKVWDVVMKLKRMRLADKADTHVVGYEY